MSPDRFAPMALALLSSACAGPRLDPGLEDVQALAAERVPQRLHWRRGAPEDAEVDREVRALLAAPLSADAAVQVALLENRALQATYERLGVAQADLVQAGLLRNPVFFASARFPDGAPSRSNLELAVVQDFLDVLLRARRVELAEVQLEATTLAVAHEVVDFAAEVRGAYFAALGAAQVAAMRGLVVDAAGAAAELAERLHGAGNISDLAFSTELGLYEDARVAFARAEAERLLAREELTRVLGLFGPIVGFELPERLPEIPPEEVPLQDLEAMAIGRRLDLAAARVESEVLARALGVTRDWRFLAVAEVGVSSERDSDGQTVTGPELVLELPVFDRRDAEIARLAALLRQSDQRVFALAVGIRSEVRAGRDRLVALRRLAQHYAGVVIPLREAMVAFTQQEYDYMLVGAFELILAKQAEYDAYQAYLETVRDYWTTRAALERAVGGGLSVPAPRPEADAPAEEAPREPEPAHDHHHHGG